MSKKQAPLHPGEFFHIFNRGNNRQTVFHCQSDYDMFLEKWERFVTPVAATIAYTLIPNHFHAVVRIRDARVPLPPLLPLELTAESAEQAVVNFFISFARSRHNKKGTDGAVFKRPYQRKRLDSEDYLRNCIAYVLLNPFLHKIVADYRAYPHSSLGRRGIEAPGLIDWNESDRIFGDANALERFLLEIQENRRTLQFGSWHERC